MAIRLIEWERVIAMHVNGVPLPALEDAVRHACIEFCQRTLVDTRTVTALNYVAAEPDTIIPDPDERTTVCRVINVWSAEKGFIDPRSRPEIDAKYTDAAWVNMTAESFLDVWGWISLRPYSVRLVPKVTTDGIDELTVEYAVQPRRDATHVEDYLYQHFGEDIGWGALARLHAHVEAPYANGALVTGYRAAFNAAIERHSHRRGAGHNKARLRSGGDRIA